MSEHLQYGDIEQIDCHHDKEHSPPEEHHRVELGLMIALAHIFSIVNRSIAFSVLLVSEPFVIATHSNVENKRSSINEHEQANARSLLKCFTLSRFDGYESLHVHLKGVQSYEPDDWIEEYGSFNLQCSLTALW